MNTGFCCDFKAMNKAERLRYQELREKLENAVEDRRELEHGYAFRLRGGEVSLTEVAEWVEKERKCCPFFDFEIAAERDGGAVWLRLMGAEGVKEFIRMEFRGFEPAA